MKTAYITCLFSPASRLVAYREFKKQFEDLGIPLLVAELSFNGVFESHELGIKEHGDARNLLWQKEALLNALVAKLPPEYDTIAFLDCDMVFQDGFDWTGQAEKLMNKYRAVQLFSKTLYFDQHGGINKATYGWAAKRDQYNPGGAWMVRRELFPLIDYMVIGGGDRVMASGWAGSQLNRTEGFQHNWPLLAKLKRDMASQYAKCKGKIGYLDTANFHLYHGELETRRYSDRLFALGQYWFNPDTDVTRENGILAWTPAADPRLKTFVADYFQGRA